MRNSLCRLVLLGASLGALFTSAPAQPAPPMPPGTTANHYLLDTEDDGPAVIFNRFKWWGKVPPPTGPITEPFENEFCPPLARVVGDPTNAPAGFAVISWVGWQSFLAVTANLEFATRNDRPRSEPELMSLPGSRGAQPLTGLVNLYRGPLPLPPLTGDNFRPSLFFDFERGQRAVGLEFGFIPLPGGDRTSTSGESVHLYGLNRAGERIRGAEAIGTTHVDAGDFTNRIGVRSSRGNIFSVELRFEHGAGDNLQDQQAVLRIWHEPLPPAAVKQGAVAVGSFNPGNARGPASLGTISEALPFNCDRAVVLMRGFWLKYHDDNSHDVGEVSAGFGVNDTVRSTTPGGSVTWTPTATMRPRQSSAGTTSDAVIYYSILAWDSQQTELLTATADGSASADGDRAFVNMEVPDPLGRSVGFGTSSDPAVWREQTLALRGHLFSGLSRFSFTADEDHDDIDEFRVGIGGFQVLGSEELYWNPSGPARGLPNRKLLWPNAALWLGDGSDTYQVSLGGTLLAGRSLRTVAERTTGQDYRSVWDGDGNLTLAANAVGPRPAFINRTTERYWNPGWQTQRRAGLSFTLQGEMAVVGLWEFGFMPGDPFRELEVEVHGANYDGRVIDWQQARGMITDTPGSGPHDVIVLPVFASVRRNADFARATLQVLQGPVNEALFSKPWGTSPQLPGQFGVIRNFGTADILVTDLVPSTNSPQVHNFQLSGVIWRGQTLTRNGFYAQVPLQLRPGEELQVQVEYFPEFALARDHAPVRRFGVLAVRTNRPDVSATMSLTANLHADIARARLQARDHRNQVHVGSYDFGPQKDSKPPPSIKVDVLDVGGIPLTIKKVGLNKNNPGWVVRTPRGLTPKPEPGFPTMPPRLEIEVSYTLGQNRLGKQRDDLVVVTNAGVFTFPVQIEVIKGRP